MESLEKDVSEKKKDSNEFRRKLLRSIIVIGAALALGEVGALYLVNETVRYYELNCRVENPNRICYIIDMSDTRISEGTIKSGKYFPEILEK